MRRDSVGYETPSLEMKSITTLRVNPLQHTNPSSKLSSLLHFLTNTAFIPYLLGTIEQKTDNSALRLQAEQGLNLKWDPFFKIKNFPFLTCISRFATIQLPRRS